MKWSIFFNKTFIRHTLLVNKQLCKGLHVQMGGKVLDTLIPALVDGDVHPHDIVYKHAPGIL